MRVAIGREKGKGRDSRAMKQMIILIERDAVFEFILNRKMNKWLSIWLMAVVAWLMARIPNYRL